MSQKELHGSVSVIKRGGCGEAPSARAQVFVTVVKKANKELNGLNDAQLSSLLGRCACWVIAAVPTLR